jgi:iron complex transport system ATP-binding protein
LNLAIKKLSAGYAGRQVLFDVNASMETGEIVCLLGPNGSGKTTLFKTILGLIPSSGAIYLDAVAVNSLHARQRAQSLAYIPQLHNPPFPFTAFEVVLTGRTPFMGMFSSPTASDRAKALESMDLLKVGHLVCRNYAELSGGERQLILIARALAQSPRFLIMDEPTSHLDYGNQLRTLKVIQKLARTDMGIILTTHVPDHAFMCATRVIALRSGRVLADGKPLDALTPSILHQMYDVDVDIINLSQGRCVCAPAERNAD